MANPNGNPDNLVPNTERTPEQIKENARKAGIASGEARRRKKAFRELFDGILGEHGGVVAGKEVTKKEGIAYRAINMLVKEETSDKDFLKALEIVRDTIGEKPVEKVLIAEVDQEIIDEVERLVMEDDD